MHIGSKISGALLSKAWTLVLPLLALVVLLPQLAFSQVRCESIFTASKPTHNAAGARFLHSREQRLHTTPLVERVALQARRESGQALQKPAEKIEAWIQHLDAIVSKAQNSRFAQTRIKEIFYQLFVIKPNDVPESYFDTQIRIARERGHGEIKLTDEQRIELTSSIINDQKKSLDVWVEYLISSESSIYPSWMKYWILNGVTKLSKYNVELGIFGNRDRRTVSPFPELNREALAFVVDGLLSKVTTDRIPEKFSREYQQLLEGANFGKLYGYVLKGLSQATQGSLKNTNGKWVRYPKGSAHEPLVRSLEGKNTGWCTAASQTAKSQLASGDFYVYYSLDTNGQPTQPRAAIRLEEDRIAEVRGIGKDQNLDSAIADSSVVSEKLKNFGSEGVKYNKRVTDMNRLTAIDARLKTDSELPVTDLRFLYELDSTIEGFGHHRDPRIDAIKRLRNPKADLIKALGIQFSDSDIALSRPEWNSGNHTVYIGKFDDGWRTTFGELEKTVFPKFLYGNFILNLTQLRGAYDSHEITLPREVHGSVSLYNLKFSGGLRLPDLIDGDLDMRSLTSAAGVVFPAIKGKLYVGSEDVLNGAILVPGTRVVVENKSEQRDGFYRQKIN